jgi:hypothetical protein
MWIITKDLITSKCCKSEVNKCSHDYYQKLHENKPIMKEFRLLDDDGIVYYHGESDTDDDDNAFEPLDYYEAHSGCTEIQYKDKSGKWETL